MAESLILRVLGKLLIFLLCIGSNNFIKEPLKRHYDKPDAGQSNPLIHVDIVGALLLNIFKV